MKRKFDDTDSGSDEGSFVSSLNNPQDLSIFSLMRNSVYMNFYRSLLNKDEPDVLLLNFLVQENTLGELFNILIPGDDELLKSVIFNTSQDVPSWRVSEVKDLLNRSLTFILKHRSCEVLEFFLSAQDITNQLLLHLSKREISNLLIEIIIQEEKLKEKNEIGYEWTIKTNLSEKIINILESEANYFYSPLLNFINELVSKCNANAAVIKSIFLEQDCYLIRYYFSQLISNQIGIDVDLMKFIEENIITIYLFNKKHEEELQLDTEIFSSIIYQTLREETATIMKTIHKEKAELSQIVIGMKYILVLLKNGVNSLIGNSQKEIFHCLDLCFKFSQANVLHNVLLNIFECIIANDREDELNSQPPLICCLLQEGLVEKIINGFLIKEKNNFRYHLRLISCALRDSKSHKVKVWLSKDPHWNRYLDIFNKVYTNIPLSSPFLLPMSEQPTGNYPTIWTTITDTLFSFVSKGLSLATGAHTPNSTQEYLTFREKELNFIAKLEELITL